MLTFLPPKFDYVNHLERVDQHRHQYVSAIVFLNTKKPTDYYIIYFRTIHLLMGLSNVQSSCEYETLVCICFFTDDVHCLYSLKT